jgi:hypothetical protein
MKKKRNTQKKSKTEMRTEYDFSDGVRGKYSKRYSHSNNLVVIARDVAEFFGDSQAVNEALRTLLRLKSAKTKAA